MSDLMIVRQIAARPEIVFEAMTTAEGLRAWFGPEDTPILLAESDPRVGGAYRIRLQTDDDGVYECHGTYLQVDPPSRFAMSFQWVEDDGSGVVSRIEASLDPRDGGTELTFVHLGLADDASRDRHVGGWNQSFDKLARIVVAVAR